MNISLKSRIIKKLLNFFFLHKEERFYVNELSKILNENCANLYRQLLKLLKEGILCDEFQGNQRYFFLNLNYRFLDEYRTIIDKTFGLENILKTKLSEIQGIEKVIIFGSYASNKLTPDSDLDILIVGNHDIKKTAKILTNLQTDWHIEINPIEYSPNEYKNKIKSKDNFLINILKNPIIQII